MARAAGFIEDTLQQGDSTSGFRGVLDRMHSKADGLCIGNHISDSTCKTLIVSLIVSVSLRFTHTRSPSSRISPPCCVVAFLGLHLTLYLLTQNAWLCRVIILIIGDFTRHWGQLKALRVKLPHHHHDDIPSAIQPHMRTSSAGLVRSVPGKATL